MKKDSLDLKCEESKNEMNSGSQCSQMSSSWKWSITDHSLLLALELNVADITYYNDKVTAQRQTIEKEVF